MTIDDAIADLTERVKGACAEAVIRVKKRSAEAMQLISASKQAKLQEQLAQTMETFNIGDDASTFQEMREKIDRRVAAAEAKLQLGASSVDSQMQDIEREAMDIQLQDKLLEYKQSMGMLGAGNAGGANKQNSRLLAAAWFLFLHWPVFVSERSDRHCHSLRRDCALLFVTT